MRIVVNGKPREIGDPITLSELLHSLELQERQVAVEVNRDIVRRNEWTDRRLQEGDKIEIVHFVGGG